MHRHIARMERSLRGLTWDAPVHIFDVVAIRQVTDNELGLARVIVHREFNGIFQILAEGVKIGAAIPLLSQSRNNRYPAHTVLLTSGCSSRKRGNCQQGSKCQSPDQPSWNPHLSGCLAPSASKSSGLYRGSPSQHKGNCHPASRVSGHRIVR